MVGAGTYSDNNLAGISATGTGDENIFCFFLFLNIL